MKANRLYHLIVSREGLEPAFLSDPNRTDRIEVVSVDDGEVILYWTVSPKQASKLLEAAARRSREPRRRGVLRQVARRRRGGVLSGDVPRAKPPS